MALIPLAFDVALQSPLRDGSDCRGRIEGVLELRRLPADHVSVLLQIQIHDALPRRAVEKHGREADPFARDVGASILSFGPPGQHRLAVRDSVFQIKLPDDGHLEFRGEQLPGLLSRRR